MSCIAGRLLCDASLRSGDLLKEVYQILNFYHGRLKFGCLFSLYNICGPLYVSYSLTQLAKTQLNKDREEISPHEIPATFQTSGSLLELIGFKQNNIFLGKTQISGICLLCLDSAICNDMLNGDFIFGSRLSMPRSMPGCLELMFHLSIFPLLGS